MYNANYMQSTFTQFKLQKARRNYLLYKKIFPDSGIDSLHQVRVTKIIRTSFWATNIRHQFVKRLERINILSSAFSCCWQIFVSQKISDLKALTFRWFLVRRTTQGINLARTTSRKAPKIKALGLVRIILVTLKYDSCDGREPFDFNMYNVYVHAQSNRWYKSLGTSLPGLNLFILLSVRNTDYWRGNNLRIHIEETKFPYFGSKNYGIL